MAVQVARLRSEGELATRLLSSKERSVAALTQQLATHKTPAAAAVAAPCDGIAAEECHIECATVAVKSVCYIYLLIMYILIY